MTLVRIPESDLAVASTQVRDDYFRYLIAQAEALGGWDTWNRLMFPEFFTAPFADHQEAFWTHIWSIEAGVKPAPFCAIWPRGGAKSTSAEVAIVNLGARNVRRFFLYVSGTQAKADLHVDTIGGMLESPKMRLAYPDMADRKVNQYGTSKGWRRSELRTRSGFTVAALGLDVDARGAKLDEIRPDGIVFDDVDHGEDTEATVQRKIRLITEALLPAGSQDTAVFGIQNLIHARSIFARLAGRPWCAPDVEPAEFLADRIVSGPVPAVMNMETDERETPKGRRFVIVAGEPSWVGQSVEVCQAQIDEWGITAFDKEAQHSTAPPPGGMFSHLTYTHEDLSDELMGRLTRVAVWCDPAVSDTDRSDSYAIQADGIDAEGVIYRLRSWEQRTNPEDALRRALLWAVELGAPWVGVETDQGGDTWAVVYRSAWSALVDDHDHPEITEHTARPGYRYEQAGSTGKSKAGRLEEMRADYERPGRIVHVVGPGTGMGTLEAGLNRFPLTKPYDLADAAYWAWRDLRGSGSSPAEAAVPQGTFGRSPVGQRTRRGLVG